jgi:hypothetical protein
MGNLPAGCRARDHVASRRSTWCRPVQSPVRLFVLSACHGRDGLSRSPASHGSQRSARESGQLPKDDCPAASRHQLQRSHSLAYQLKHRAWDRL